MVWVGTSTTDQDDDHNRPVFGDCCGDKSFLLQSQSIAEIYAYT